MSTFTLAISCLTTSNLPWFMDLTFQVPMQYCPLQHRTFLLSPVTSTAGCCFCFGSIPSFFLELFLHWSPVAYWAPTDLRSSSFSILSFCLFLLFMGFSRQEYWTGLPFPSPVDNILSDLSTMTRRSWVAPWTWLSFIELDKAVVLVWWDWLVFCECGFSVSALWCPLATPTVLLWFLLPWAWGISSRLPQQSAATAPYPLGINELKWAGMGEFNSDDHYIYYWGQESLRRWSSHHGQQKSPKCSTWMHSQKWQNDLCSFPRHTIQYHSNPSLCPNQ